MMATLEALQEKLNKQLAIIPRLKVTAIANHHRDHMGSPCQLDNKTLVLAPVFDARHIKLHTLISLPTNYQQLHHEEPALAQVKQALYQATGLLFELAPHDTQVQLTQSDIKQASALLPDTHPMHALQCSVNRMLSQLHQHAEFIRYENDQQVSADYGKNQQIHQIATDLQQAFNTFFKQIQKSAKKPETSFVLLNRRINTILKKAENKAALDQHRGNKRLFIHGLVAGVSAIGLLLGLSNFFVLGLALPLLDYLVYAESKRYFFFPTTTSRSMVNTLVNLEHEIGHACGFARPMAEV